MNNYKNNRAALIQCHNNASKPAETVRALVELIGYESAAEIVAMMVICKGDWDERISNRRRAWAQNLTNATADSLRDSFNLYYCDSIHPAHLDQIAAAMMAYTPAETPETVAEATNPTNGESLAEVAKTAAEWAQESERVEAATRSALAAVIAEEVTAAPTKKTAYERVTERNPNCKNAWRLPGYPGEIWYIFYERANVGDAWGVHFASVDEYRAELETIRQNGHTVREAWHQCNGAREDITAQAIEEASRRDTFGEILNKIKEAREAITNTEESAADLAREFMRETYRSGTPAEMESAKAKYKEAEARYISETERNAEQKIRIQILSDNAKQAFFAENIGKICEIWNKYSGKAYGEKTREKIREEIKNAIGCYSNIGNRYGNALITIYYNLQTGAPFRELEIAPTWNGGESYPALNADNKIVPLNAARLRLCYCGEYVENVTEHINALKKAHAAAKEAYKAYQNAASEYNKLIRGHLEHINTREGVNGGII